MASVRSLCDCLREFATVDSNRSQSSPPPALGVLAYQFRLGHARAHSQQDEQSTSVTIARTSMASLRRSMGNWSATRTFGMGCPSAAAVGLDDVPRQLACPLSLHEPPNCFVPRMEELKLAALDALAVVGGSVNALIVVEQDMLWLRSPLRLFPRKFDECDVVLTVHTSGPLGLGALNTGVTLIRANSATRALWKDIINETVGLVRGGADCRGGRNQAATMNVVLGTRYQARHKEPVPLAPRDLIGSPDGVLTRHGARVCFDDYQQRVLELSKPWPSQGFPCVRLKDHFTGVPAKSASMLHFKEVARDIGAVGDGRTHTDIGRRRANFQAAAECELAFV